MVVGALVAYFAPSNRGFVKVKDSKDILFDSSYYDNNENDVDVGGIDGGGDDDDNYPTSSSSSRRKKRPITTLRRKPLRAMAILTSIASDFDLISDWLFFHQSLYKDQQYRKEYINNIENGIELEDGALPYLIPKRLLISVFICCILGTIMYLIIATEGRIVSPIMKQYNIDKISMGFMLFLSVLVEDIPQIILTFLIEDYYEEEQFLSEFAVFNLMASLYDTCIKLAESYDQRHDVVETGIWCKRSILNSHNATITNIHILPDGINIPTLQSSQTQTQQQQQQQQQLKYQQQGMKTKPLPTITSRSQSETAAVLPSKSISTSNLVSTRRKSSLPSMSLREMSSTTLSFTTSFRRMSKKPLLVEAFFPEEEPIAKPRIPFLTTSMDGTAKLWNITSSSSSSSSTTTKLSSSSSQYFNLSQASLFSLSSSTSPPPSSLQYADNQCLRIYRDEESKGFTCLAWVGDINPKTQHQQQQTNKNIRDNDNYCYFLTGCNNGDTKLWDLNGTCHKTFRQSDKNNRVASIATAIVNSKHIFVCGHESGIIRIWNVWDDDNDDDDATKSCCLREIQGHSKRVSSITFVSDYEQFVSASIDSTLKLWNIQKLLPIQNSNDVKSDPGATLSLQCKTTESNDQKVLPMKKFVGHTGAVLSVACVDHKSAILSGSQDRTARLWSIDTGLCLRVFHGHMNGIHTVLAIDRVTFLTGSADCTIKAWDALSGECLRTYEGHKNTVTSLSTISVSQDDTESATTFISSSADKSIKIWVLTAVSYRDPAATLDHILDLHENTCRCFDATRYSYSNNSEGSLMRACSPEHCNFDHPYYEEPSSLSGHRISK